MNSRSPTARLPPSDLVGLEPEWSTLVSATDEAGHQRTWHVLDNGVTSPRGTILCVHGNPNWSYMWRELARSMTEWRVVAVDALNMGYSERTGAQRRLAERISDLGAVTDAMGITGPVVTVAHDWGGPISMGWAQHHVDQLAGIVLMNTGVARPAATKVPSLISIARSTLRATCETTPTFLHGALRMARPQMPAGVYRGYAAPYSSPELRTGIKDFVEDIPIEASHESHDTLAAVAGGLEQLRHVPSLLLWGAKDIVFSDAFLNDLRWRLPHADVHRYADAGHQIAEDTDALQVAKTWIESLDERVSGTVRGGDGAPMWSAIAARSGDHADAIVEMGANDSAVVERTISFDELDRTIEAAAAGLVAAGVRAGDRLATLVAPGIDLTVLVYACLRAGVVLVLPDAALGLDGLARALRSARPDHIVGDWRGLALAKTLRSPANLLSVKKASDRRAAAAGISGSLEQLIDDGSRQPTVAPPSSTDLAAIVFTSGSTGPSKGVRYTHGQLQAQRDALIQTFSVDADDKLVVAFAPFAVLAPAVGITSVIPAMDVTKPATLTAQALADAARAVDGTIVFASPAVLANIAATAAQVAGPGRAALLAAQTVATAGAPVSPQLLAAVQPVFPNAQIFTPYGMTEVLPVTIASTDEIQDVGSDDGVCVGRPLPQVQVAIRAFDAPSGALPDALDVGALGEVWVRADHGSTGYDGLWNQDRHAFVEGWHRSGDVGHLDAAGRLWIEGRVAHLIHACDGAIAPVEVELQAESASGVGQAAAVGVGPVGNQQLAIVVTGPPVPRAKSGVVADPELAAAVRKAVSVDVAGVLVVRKIPVDRRHNSKIDRTRVQAWAEAMMRGESPRRV